jgi:small subunit ribosomal protein S18
MGRKGKAVRERAPKGKDSGKKFKKKVCVFCAQGATFVDYKDVNLLRRYMSDRAKIRARRVSGNCAQHQRDVATAIKTARELALLPYTVRVTSSRGGGRPGRGDRDDRPPRGDRDRDRDAESGPELDVDAFVAEGDDDAEGDELEVVAAGDGGDDE